MSENRCENRSKTICEKDCNAFKMFVRKCLISECKGKSKMFSTQRAGFDLQYEYVRPFCRWQVIATEV